MTGEGMKDEGLLCKVKVYPGEPEEHFTFTTPEARDTINRYL